jgi:FAD/FMN-containing dehydrogenase
MTRTVALSGLAERLSGSLLLPHDEHYAAVRKPFIGRFTEVLPAAVAKCATAEDVRACVGFARTRAVPFAVRAGGHSFVEWSSSPGLLVDVGRLDAVSLDQGHVTVGAGIRQGDLAARLAGAGLVVPCGWCPDVGVTGAVLGGGFGVLGRAYGLGADHLVAARVALADGRLVWCDEEREPDLYWALRGAGGGLFAAVTDLVLRTRPALAATAFEYSWPYRQAAAVVAGWLRLAPDAPDELNAELALTATDDPAEPPYVTVFGVSLGDPAPLADAFDPPPGAVRTHPMTAAETARHHAYPGESDDVIISGPPPDAPPGLQLVKSGCFTASPPVEAIRALVEHFAAHRVRGEFRDLEFVPWGGAYGRVPATATAFAHRRSRFLVRHTVQVGHRADAGRRQAADRWVTTSEAWLRPYGNGGIYPNYPDPAVPAWDPAYHGANLTRLRAVKRAYDPTDLFHPGR